MILACQSIQKAFGTDVILKNASFHIEDREKAAIVGINGAGKSTLCNMITGILPPTEGKILFEGKEVLFHHPKEALAVGIRMVYQERNLVEYLTGAQSICLGLEDRKGKFFVDEKKMMKRAVDI